ncbi:MAG TPA: amino acid adenylation domain-containing protein [Pyrinomonadaceae bacterium]
MRKYEYNLGIRFQHVVDERSDKVALWFNPHETYDYLGLNKLANRIARLLLQRKVAAGDVVCLSGEKSLYTFAFMIACLKIGVIYCVLDPNSPVERLRKVFSTCEPRLVVGEPEFLNRFAELIAGMEIIETAPGCLEEMAGALDGENLDVTRFITGTNPAYIMFTSGSTGIPKGAVMTHANVMNLIDWSRETFDICPEDILTNVNPLYFDNSVFDFYTSLLNGARLVPFTNDEVRDARLLVEKVDAAQCNVWFSVPSLLIFLQTMKAADGKRLKTITRFIFGGEGYPKAKLKTLFDLYSPHSALFNVYGPTECTCICSSYRLSSDDFHNLNGLPPLGQIAENFSFLLVDEADHEVPSGEIGELCLLGPNVGKGYYNDPERTRVSFVQNPRHASFHDLMYRTGDLARLEPADGKLYIHGRKDNQIKHMGYRIELEEIEAALNCLSYISEAAVLHTRNHELSRIVAVVCTSLDYDDQRIKRDLRPIIPDYMIPSVFHREHMLPKNPNGKVDRKYLAETYLRQTGKGNATK